MTYNQTIFITKTSNNSTITKNLTMKIEKDFCFFLITPKAYFLYSEVILTKKKERETSKKV